MHLSKEPFKYQVKQARRWLNNEGRKCDKGLINVDGKAAFEEWTSRPETFFNADDTWMAPSGQNARRRYEAERHAACQEQGRNNRLVDWWETVAARKKWRHRPGSHVTSWFEDGIEVGCCILPGCLPAGWVLPSDEKQLFIKFYVPLLYFVGVSGKIIRFGSKEDDLDKEDGGVALPGPLGEIAGDDEFNGGVALPLRLKERVDSAFAQAEEKMVALPIR
ncbi:MAG: hypothetical protein Q9212_005531 [Teloschistes hypoglaucus]